MTIKPNKVPYKVAMPNNMGVVRYVISLLIVYSHFIILTGFESPVPVSMGYTRVGAFFALSGFLIFGSYLRKNSFKVHLVNRMWRLLPAYWSTIIIFAIFLSLFSTLGPLEYFTAGEFWKYMAANLCFLNFLQPDLPGVFDNLQLPAVNGAMWTMKVEWTLFFTVPVVAWVLKKTKWSPAMVFIGLYLVASAYRTWFAWLYYTTDREIYNVLGRQFLGQLSYFYVGVLIYYYFDFFMRHKWAMLLGAVAALAVTAQFDYAGIWVQPVAVPIIVVWFSMVGKWGTWEGRHDNYSYNIYLVHFPVIQTFVSTGLTDRMGMGLSLVVILATVMVVAKLLHIVEKKIVSLRPRPA